MQVLENIGSIKAAAIPNGWFELPRPPDEMSDSWQRTFLSAFDNSVEMLFVYRGMPVDSGSALYFQDLLTSKPAETGEEKLTPDEITRLQVVLGFNTAGNNQYTNPVEKGTPGGHVFELRSAETRRVSNRTVLFVRGSFQGGKEYAGIFYSADVSGQIIEEFMMQAPSRSRLTKNIQDFDFVLDRIQWG